MKIAIQGHLTRGREVIQILESLGGRNISNYIGNCIKTAYFIGMDYSIYGFCTCSPKVGFKVYTLEEFEKEFPFKIGDIVQTKLYGEPAEIIKLYPNPACIIAYKVRYKSGKEMQYCPENIKFYKEMKEERNITLTLDKAKEWYKKGGELREVALQAFTEKELNLLPRSWEEFCKQSNIIASWRYDIPIKYQTLFKLEQLRDCWRQGNIPQEDRYKIRKVRNKYTIVYGLEDAFLSFCDLQTAEEFLKYFRDLIEKAEDLI